MDDCASIFILMLGGAILFIISHLLWNAAKRKIERDRAEGEAVLQRQREETRKWRESLNSKTKVTTSTVPPRGKETTVKYTPTYAPSPTQSVRDNDDGIDLLTTMMIANAISEHHEHSSSSSSSDSSPSYTDDSPSSSWSSSSSDSLSSWSSSDSSPSSDW